MTLRIQQVAAAVLALSAVYVGGWALLSPTGFYDDFPLPGRDWVSLAGPYNEHLVRDVGGLYLALGLVTVWAIARPAFLVTAGLAWEVFSVPHLLFHAGHLDGLDTFDKVAEIGSLAGTVVLAALLLVPRRSG
ncbi:MAG: DUF4345 family protein [Nocardioidaceae bacterium]|nr:DUF4345 family protein [Nocardioidaceae bacterium]